jgi:hypothetical protein
MALVLTIMTLVATAGYQRLDPVGESENRIATGPYCAA